MDPTVHRLTALHAAEHKRRNPDPERIAQLRAAINEARTEAFILEMLATAPPLSHEARSRLARLFGGDL